MEITFDRVTKTFKDVRAVDEVSCAFQHGAITGLVGPNGAGKTTMIRMLLDILRPDEGKILVDGRPLDEPQKNKIGYLPEERGLYKKQKIHEILEYFGMLKGLSFVKARERSAYYLERLEMSDVAKKKTMELSKGNQQKIQIAGALVHDPEFVVLDEPFSGLDPVNQLFMKDFLFELKNKGCTVVFSTHQMHQVEELCQNVFMINAGKTVLDGGLAEIKKQYSDHAVRLRLEGGGAPPENLEEVIKRESGDEGWKLFLKPDVTPSQFLRTLLARGAAVEFFELAEPPLEDIFIKIVRTKKAEGGAQ